MPLHTFYTFVILVQNVISAKQEEFDPRKTQCARESWLLDDDVVCSKGNLGGSYCIIYCGNKDLRSEIAECNCGKYCKWTLGKPQCYDPTDYDYSMYGNEYEAEPDDEESMSADSVQTVEQHSTDITTSTPTPTTAATTTTAEPTTTEDITQSTAESTTAKSKGKLSENDKAREKQEQKARKQADRKEKKKAEKQADRDVEKVNKKKMCSEVSWLLNSAVTCTDGAHKLSVCTLSCSGDIMDYVADNLVRTCRCDVNGCSWNSSEEPTCVKIQKPLKIKEEKIKPEKEVEEVELSGGMCEYHEWFDSDTVLCSHGLFNNTRCVLKECPYRQMSTEVACECFVKEDKVIKCKWQEEGKDEYNRKGPRCIRKSKRGILDEVCLEETWHNGITAEEEIKCSDDYNEGSVCNLKKCDGDKVEVPATCMCFSRSNGVTKCRWNRAPKCVVEEKDADGLDGDLFRNSVGIKICPTPHWRYLESISCTNEFYSNSQCTIDSCLGKLSPSTATCNCRGYACNWSYSLGTTEPSCVHVINHEVPNGQMLMDFVNGGGNQFSESEEIAEIDIRAITDDVCLHQTNPSVICSDENRDQSKCRRIDCKSNESRCLCYQGKCQYDRGQPECMNESLIAPGCELNKGCVGCDLPDWMDDSETQCTNFNHEGSQCYRSNCYYPLASTRATCICHMTSRNMPRCSWNSGPTCFLPTK